MLVVWKTQYQIRDGRDILCSEWRMKATKDKEISLFQATSSGTKPQRRNQYDDSWCRRIGRALITISHVHEQRNVHEQGIQDTLCISSLETRAASQ